MTRLRAGEGVLRRKPIEQIDEEGDGGGLTRTLGLWQLTAIGVGGIIGAGIFTLAGTVANGTAGPAVLISFLIAGVASAAAALSYAEFAGLIPKAGSAYTYGYAVLGETGIATTRSSRFGVSGAFTGVATVFFAVFGYDAMSTAAEESKDAQRHMPKAILYSLAISMVLYVLACLVLTGMQNYKEVDPESGFSTAFKSVGLGGLADLIAVGAIIGILTVMFTFMLGVTRVWFSMSRDGLLPKWFAKTHRTRHVPTRVTWIVGVASAVIAGFLPIGEAAELTSIGILLAFVVVCIAVIVLRYRQPDLPRTFRTPAMPFVPAVGVVFSIWLITFLQWQTWARFSVWFLLGLVINFGYSYRKSELAKTQAPKSAPSP